MNCPGTFRYSFLKKFCHFQHLVVFQLGDQMFDACFNFPRVGWTVLGTSLSINSQGVRLHFSVLDLCETELGVLSLHEGEPLITIVDFVAVDGWVEVA